MSLSSNKNSYHTIRNRFLFPIIIFQLIIIIAVLFSISKIINYPSNINSIQTLTSNSKKIDIQSENIAKNGCDDIIKCSQMFEKQISFIIIGCIILFGVLIYFIFLLLQRNSYKLSEQESSLLVQKEYLEASESRLKEAQRIAKIGSWELNIKTSELYWSDEIYRMFNLEPSEFKCTYESFIENIHPEDRDLVNSAYKNSVKNKMPYNIIHRLLLKDGTLKYVNERCETEYDEDGKPIWSIGTVHDVSDRMHLESQLHQAEKMQAIGLLAGGIAHDFNNQLAGIQGYSDIIAAEATELPNIIKFTNEISTIVQRASSLTSQLLAFSRKGNYQKIPLDIHKIIFEVLNILNHSLDKKIIVKQTLNANPPMVMGDSTQIQNAILNLGINARDAMPNGGELHISTDVVNLDQDFCTNHSFEITEGRYLLIAVSDSGVGMDSAIQNRIFEPFFTTKEQGKGTGMGLAAVYGTVKNHHGLITVYSKLDNGSIFNIYLPLLEDKITLSQPTSEYNEVISGSGHILFVEDEEMIRNIGSKILKKLGYTVSICNNGREAVDYYKENWQNIDLVILDIVMPIMGGKEAFEMMQKINPNILSLVSSGYSVDGEAQEMLDDGVNGFLQKPYKKAELSQKIYEVLHSS